MKDKGDYAIVPEDLHPPIEQACVILRVAKNKNTAQQFLAFVKTDAIGALLRSYGFDVDSAAAKK